MVKISTELSSSTWVSTAATEDDRQDRGKKRQDKDKDREEIIGNKREDGDKYKAQHSLYEN